MKKKEALALKLPFEPGESLCTWVVPGLEGEPVELSGLLTLEVGKYPYGVLYGDMPIEWVDGAASFPQRHRFESLVGRLSSGGSVALMNGELHYWFETQGRATGAFAVLSRDQLDAKKPRKYKAIELQIDGIDAIMGKSPISQVKMPRKAGDEPVWSASINRDANAEWESAGDQLSVWFNASIRALDFYEFSMVFGSVLRITVKDALTVDEWWLEWVRPLRQLISLVTQGSRSINGFLAVQGESNKAGSRDQVFGWDISQSPRNTSRDEIEATQTLVNLAADEANLLLLLQSWRTLSTAHHPLLETYGSMTTTAEQHPRSRLLLLLQALEGLYGFETSDQRAKNEQIYTEKREGVLKRAGESSLETADVKFLKKHVMKRPSSGLLDALGAIFKSLPVDIRPELDTTSLFATVRSLDPTLDKERAERILVKIRNDLSHGSANYDVQDLKHVADLLERVVRSETLRVIGAPESSRKRALENAND
ncbi:MAG: hypothetical protein PIR02_12225 [Microbacterium enclense]